MDDNFERHSIRLKRFDYSSPGAYFVTICVEGHKCVFGRITEGKMELRKFGEIAQTELLRSSEIRKEMIIDAFVIMPNHIHILETITVGANGGSPGHQSVNQRANGRSPLPQMRSRSVSSFVAGYKSSTTKQINILRGTPGAAFWQRNYYERVVRDEAELSNIRQYISLNPMQWQYDRENEHRVQNDKYSEQWRGLL